MKNWIQGIALPYGERNLGRRRAQCCWTKKPRAVSHNWTGCDSQMCVNMTFQFPLKVFFVRETEVSAKIDDILNTLLHRTISTQSCAKWIVIVKDKFVWNCFIKFQNGASVILNHDKAISNQLHTGFIYKTFFPLIR